ncbi:MAG: hypothetical protein IPM64_12100 [Phycisphaerales bacterium]|nr:hypothetical protein [Phycisphaerales bacterium]
MQSPSLTSPIHSSADRTASLHSHALAAIRLSVRVVLPAFLISLALPPALAEYPADVATNLIVSDDVSEQTQSKVRATADGGCYISWYSNALGGYDMYLQRLDRDGVPQWADHGIRIADLAHSSTQDYGIAVDSGGHALLTYRDDRPGTTQVGVNRIAPDGTLLWGANGVVLPGSLNGNRPVVAILDDDSIVVGYTASTSPATIVLHRLDPDGNLLWGGSGVTVADPAAPTSRPLNLSDLQPGIGTTVIALWVRCTGANCVTSNKHLYAQMYDETGGEVWNSGTPVEIFTANSIQTAYFPTFVADGAGGAVIPFYETGATRRVRVQHLEADGTPLYPANGIETSLQESGKIALSPSGIHDPASGDTYVAWTEANSGQSQWGVFAQRLSGGARQWGHGGLEVVGLSANQSSFVRVVPGRNGGMVTFWIDRSGSALIVGAALDENGSALWTPAVRNSCSTLSGKSRLDAVAAWPGQALLTWGDSRFDVRDAYAQNARLCDGRPGALHLGDLNCDGLLNNFDIDPFVLAILDEAAYNAAYPGCDRERADINADCAVNNFDIDPFVALLLGL